MEAVVGAELREESAFGENFRGRGGNKQFVRIERIDDLSGVEGIELDTEVGMSKFGAADDFSAALCERIFGLRVCGDLLGCEETKEEPQVRGETSAGSRL